MDKRTIHVVCNMEIYEPALWERIILAFCKLELVEGEAGAIWYKVFLDRLYIYRREWKRGAPKALAVPWDGGASSPWMN